MIRTTANIKWNRVLGIIHELSRQIHFISPSRNYCVLCCAFIHRVKVPSNKNRQIYAKKIKCKATQHISLLPSTYSQQWTQISVKGSQAEQHCLSGRGNRVLNKRKNAVQERLFQFHCIPPRPLHLSWYEVRTARGAKTGYTRQQNVSYYPPKPNGNCMYEIL